MKDSKNIETHVIKLLNGVNESQIIDDDKYKNAAISIYNHIKTILDSNIISIEHKPRVKSKPVYSNSNEPKTDIIINTDKNYNLSLKLDDGAYLVSCNSPVDFIKQFIEIHDGSQYLNPDIIDRLQKSALYIKKVPNFYSYDVTYKKDKKLDEFLMDKFYPKANKSIGESKANKYVNYIKDCYNDKVKQLEYINYLHESESYIQETMKKLFIEYPDYSKKIIFECMTGCIKFRNSNCSCNWIVTIDGIWKLNNHNCEYVNYMYNKFINSPKIGRLQNVPRKKILNKNLKSNNLEIIANDFSIADLTFKL